MNKNYVITMEFSNNPLFLGLSKSFAEMLNNENLMDANATFKEWYTSINVADMDQPKYISKFILEFIGDPDMEKLHGLLINILQVYMKRWYPSFMVDPGNKDVGMIIHVDNKLRDTAYIAFCYLSLAANIDKGNIEQDLYRFKREMLLESFYLKILKDEHFTNDVVKSVIYEIKDLLDNEIFMVDHHNYLNHAYKHFTKGDDTDV